jgi:hypothetical protein
MHDRRRLVRILLPVLAALSSTVWVVAQDVTLRYRWTKGEELRYRTTAQTDMTMTGLPGMGDMNVTTVQVQVHKMVADDVAADGAATVRVTYESMKMTMNMPMMGEVTYDSAAPEAAAGNPLAENLKPLGALVGQPFTMVVSPAGKINRIDGLAPILEKARAGMAAAAGGALGAGDLNAILSEDSQRIGLERSLLPMPERATKVGETWKNSLKVPNPMGAQVVADVYTLKEVAAGIARVSSAGTVKPEGAPGTMGPMTVAMGDGTSQGEVVFDVKAGRVNKSTSVVSLPLTMTMSSPDGTTLNIQAATKTTTTVELIQK